MDTKEIDEMVQRLRSRPLVEVTAGDTRHTVTRSGDLWEHRIQSWDDDAQDWMTEGVDHDGDDELYALARLLCRAAEEV